MAAHAGPASTDGGSLSLEAAAAEIDDRPASTGLPGGGGGRAAEGAPRTTVGRAAHQQSSRNGDDWRRGGGAPGAGEGKGLGKGRGVETFPCSAVTRAWLSSGRAEPAEWRRLASNQLQTCMQKRACAIDLVALGSLSTTDDQRLTRPKCTRSGATRRIRWRPATRPRRARQSAGCHR